MGWAIAITLVIVGLINHDSLMIVGGGIFAIAGSIVGCRQQHQG